MGETHTSRTWKFRCYFHILRHNSSAKYENHIGNSLCHTYDGVQDGGFRMLTTCLYDDEFNSEGGGVMMLIPILGTSQVSLSWHHRSASDACVRSASSMFRCGGPHSGTSLSDYVPRGIMQLIIRSVITCYISP